MSIHEAEIMNYTLINEKQGYVHPRGRNNELYSYK